MKETLAIGIENELQHKVTADMTPSHITAPVLSTPSMVGLIEGTCLRSMLPHLDEGETSVGTHICISHSAAAYVDEVITISPRLQEIKTRRFTFEVQVRSPRGEISKGTHERAVIQPSRLERS